MDGGKTHKSQLSQVEAERGYSQRSTYEEGSVSPCFPLRCACNHSINGRDDQRGHYLAGNAWSLRGHGVIRPQTPGETSGSDRTPYPFNR